MTKAKKIIAVYEIRNLVNDKFYIGSSANLYERFRTHKKKLRNGSHPNKHLQSSWNKHGEAKFSFTKLAEFGDVHDMFVCEKGLIDTHIENPQCFNLARWVDTPMRGRFKELHHNYGKPMSEEQRAKLSEQTKKQWEESDPRTGKKHTRATKKEISDKVRKADAEGRGKRHHEVTEETRQKMSEALKGNQCAKGYKRTTKEKKAISERMKGNQQWLGRNHTEESKAKMSKRVHEITNAREFHSLTAALKFHGMTMPTLRRALVADKPISKGKFKGLWFRYAGYTLEEAENLLKSNKLLDY